MRSHHKVITNHLGSASASSASASSVRPIVLSLAHARLVLCGGIDAADGRPRGAHPRWNNVMPDETRGDGDSESDAKSRARCDETARAAFFCRRDALQVVETGKEPRDREYWRRLKLVKVLGQGGKLGQLEISIRDEVALCAGGRLWSAVGRRHLLGAAGEHREELLPARCEVDAERT